MKALKASFVVLDTTKWRKNCIVKQLTELLDFSKPSICSKIDN